jgi:antitoxin (DNA-binding transcriptional repressor) of toxin-antitoxin stability system
MRSVSISVTEASRNFADCINRARYQGTTFVLHKNGVAVARIVPEGKAHAGEEPTQKPEKPIVPSQPGNLRSEGASERQEGRRRAIW